MKVNELNNLIEDSLFSEVKKRIIKESEESKHEVFHIKCEGKPLATFKTEKEAKEELPKYKKSHPDMELIIEKGVYESHEDMIDKLDEMGDKLESENKNQDMKKSPIKVKSFAEAIMHAKENNKTHIKIGDETHDVNECWKQMEEEEGDETHDDDNHSDFEEKIKSNKKSHSDSDSESDFKSKFKGVDLGKSFSKLKDKLDEEEECDECGGGNGYMEEEEFDMHELHPSHNEGDDFSDLECSTCMGTGHLEGGKECRACGGTGMETPHIEDMGDDDYGWEDDDDKDNDLRADDQRMIQRGYDEGKEMCSECGSPMEEGVCNECSGLMMQESKKKTLRLTESELVSLISKMVLESTKGNGAPFGKVVNKPKENTNSSKSGVPGLAVTKRAQDGSKKENDQNMKEVGSEIKKRESFNNNDNPEFPKPIGKGEKMAINNTSEENEYVEDNRGGGMQDLRYDHEPSERFKQRLKHSLEGHTTMGNSQDAANVVKSDLGKNIKKNAERKEKKRKEAPMYNKDAQPVKIVKESEKPKVLLEEMEKMKKLSFYNKKTQ